VANKRKIYQSLLIVLILLGVSVAPLQARALLGEVTTNQFTQPDVVDTTWEHDQEIPETYELIAENDSYELHANQETLAFKVLDKRSGYIWHSNLDEKQDGDRLNKTWTAYAQSGISIDYMDEKAQLVRNSITNAKQETRFEKKDQGFEASVQFTDPSITIVVKVSLEEDGVRVDIPFDLIEQADQGFKLGVLYVYPFFGYTRAADVPGYMLIPDGSGSLIRFSETTKAKNMFYGKYYGSDLGMLTKLAFDPAARRPFNLSVPVFGMVHGYKQNGIIAIVEKGASYGELQVHPSGVITNFNFINNVFLYNESYYQATNRSGAGVTTIQQETNRFDVTMHYRFLTADQADYVGMARSYQQYLLDRGELSKVQDQQDHIGIKLEFLGGEKEKVLIWNRLIPMTTVEQMQQILGSLQISNPEVVYYGWQPLGASTMSPKTLKIDKGLGSKQELEQLVSDVLAQGGNFYLYLDPQSALIDEKGYSPRFDLAMSISNANLQGFNRNKVNYYLNINATRSLLAPLRADVTSDLGAGLALDSIGFVLYSDFKGDGVFTREQMIASYRELLEEDNSKLSFYKPNDYLYPYMGAYYDMPISTSGYIYTSDTVPFLQIVLSGFVPYYGKALNFSSDQTQDILRHADYGVYPAYFLTQEVTANILNTGSSWIYTSSLGQWQAEVERTYARLDALLGPVQGESIIAREVLAQGVVATTYSNGKQIIVNYSDKTYSNAGVVVESEDAILTEVNP